MTELHTITWAVKRMRQMKSALQECESYFEELADAEILHDGPSGNREMQLLVEVQAALRDSGSGAQAMRPEGAQSEGPQSGGASRIAQPSEPNK